MATLYCILLTLTINSVRDQLLKVEYPLVENNLKKIDQSLERALSELTWTSPGM